MNTHRLSWNELWLDTAILVGRRSQCSRAQYGAVIVSEDNRVLSVGYNGPPAGKQQNGSCDSWCKRAVNAEIGKPVDPNYLDCDAVHAEQNAILRAPNLWLEKNPILYVNGVTCHRCALIIANSGIKTVVLRWTPYEEKRDPAGTRELLEQYGVSVHIMDENGQEKR
jgi:dCMP deaminase